MAKFCIFYYPMLHMLSHFKIGQAKYYLIILQCSKRESMYLKELKYPQ